MEMDEWYLRIIGKVNTDQALQANIWSLNMQITCVSFLGNNTNYIHFITLICYTHLHVFSSFFPGSISSYIFLPVSTPFVPTTTYCCFCLHSLSYKWHVALPLIVFMNSQQEL